MRLGPQKTSWSKGAGAKTRQQQAPDQQAQAVRTTNRFTNLDASSRYVCTDSTFFFLDT